MKKPLLLLAVTAVLSTSVYAASAFNTPKDAVTYRQATFQLIRHNMADISDMLKGDVSYEAERVQKRADALATLTALPWEAFTVPGTEKGGGDAKAAIWKNLSDFQERGNKLNSDAVALQTAATSGDQAEIRKAFGTFARNCKACHDQYKD